MAQAKVTDFYVQRKISKRTESQSMKRRKLSPTSSDYIAKKVGLPFKKPKLEQEVETFHNFNIKTFEERKFGDVSFHDFTKALNANCTSEQSMKSAFCGRPTLGADLRPNGFSNDSRGKQNKGRKILNKKGNQPVTACGKTKATSGNLNQNCTEKPTTLNYNRNSESQNLTPPKQCSALEKTPTKRSGDKSKAPVRRKKAREVFEESGYSSYSSDNQNKKGDSQARRCLSSNFQTEEDSSSTVVCAEKQTNVRGKDGESEICEKKKDTPQTTFEVAAKRNTLANKSTLKKQETSASQQLTDTSAGTSAVNKSKKKLSPEEMREKLAKCGKLEEVRAVLDKVKRSSQIKTSKVKVPEKPKEKQPEALPAYKKYQHLVIPPSLSLPFRYRTLEEMFHGMDTVASMLHNRQESCSFSKLQAGVQELCRKSFKLNNLGQIKTVYPSSYNYYQQKKTKQISGRSKDDGSSHELMVEANLNDAEIIPTGRDKTGASTSSTGTMTEIHSQQNFLQKFTPSLLIARRTIFHSKLVDIVKQQHKEFLAKQEPPLFVPDDQINRWHPKFPLEQVKDIEPSPLPQPPNVKTYSTARDVLNKAKDLMNPKVAKALELIAEKNETLNTSSDSSSKISKPVITSTNPKPSSGVSSDLLERIRAKEARNLQAAMMRSEVDEERIGMLERLPEMCLIVRGLFLAEKKAALTVDVVVQKLGDSYRTSLSQANLEKHLKLMQATLPDWLTSVKIRKETYLKIDKKKEMKDLSAQIEKALKEAKRK